jgi:hypothetical protein
LKGEVHTVFWWGNLRERDHSEDPGVSGKIILTFIFKTWNGGMDWIVLAQNNNRWWAIVNPDSIKCEE